MFFISYIIKIPDVPLKIVTWEKVKAFAHLFPNAPTITAIIGTANLVQEEFSLSGAFIVIFWYDGLNTV